MKSIFRRVVSSVFLVSCLAVGVLLACSCSKAPSAARPSLALSPRSASNDKSMKDETSNESGGTFGFVGDFAAGKSAPAEPKAQAQIPNQSSRKLIKTGSIKLESRDIDAAEEKISSLARGLGGYVSSSNNAASYLSVTMRVPQDKFNSGMAGLKGLGKLMSRSENVEDVTLQYVDQESRIATRKILRDRYIEYLKRAGKVEELLSVERALNDVLSELDSMESAFKVLKDQIDYSTITVNVSLPPEATPAAQRSFLGGLARVWDGFIGFLYFAGYAVIAIILFGLPSLLFLGLLYWLGFGKIGLLKKFFSLLSGRKKSG